VRKLFETDELDQATFSYLHTIATTEGKDAPGVYISAADDANTNPHIFIGLCLFLSLLVFLLTLFMLVIVRSDPIAVALLLTALLCVAFWLLFTGVRLYLGQSISGFSLGYFIFVDPLYVWRVSGNVVRVRSIELLLPSRNDAEALLQATVAATIRCADGRENLQSCSHQKRAELAAFLWALSGVAEGTPAQRGYEALRRTRDDFQEPKTQINEIPRPKQVGTKDRWLILRWVVVAALLYGPCYLMACVQRDELAYRESQVNAAGLRAYLLDARNTRHRDKAQEQLEDRYSQAARGLQKQPLPLELRQALAALLQTRAALPRPWATVRFVQEQPVGQDHPRAYLSAAAWNGWQQEIVRGIATTMNRTEPLIDFVESQENFANLVIHVKFQMHQTTEGVEGSAEWRFEIQSTADAEKVSILIPDRASLKKASKADLVRHLCERCAKLLSSHSNEEPK
jgi:hypothetical protein